MRTEKCACLEDGVDVEAFAFDPEMVGNTCGGVALLGWYVCPECSTPYLGPRSRPAESWRLAKSGRSVETGSARIRFDGDENGKLAARVARLPDLELFYERVVRALQGDDLRDGVNSAILRIKGL